MSSCLRIAAEATDPTDLFFPPVAQPDSASRRQTSWNRHRLHDANVVPQDFAVAGTCVYVPPGLNGPGSEKPAIDSTFA